MVGLKHTWRICDPKIIILLFCCFRKSINETLNNVGAWTQWSTTSCQGGGNYWYCFGCNWLLELHNREKRHWFVQVPVSKNWTGTSLRGVEGLFLLLELHGYFCARTKVVLSPRWYMNSSDIWHICIQFRLDLNLKCAFSIFWCLLFPRWWISILCIAS